VCNLCGSAASVPLHQKLGIIKCADCGLARADHVPPGEELQKLYSEQYFRSSDSGALGYDDYAADRANIAKTFGKRMAEIERWTGRKGRLLDVGCAMGFSLEAARGRGWEPHGVEISEYACEYARRDLGIEVFHGRLGEAEFEAEYFDVITMWDYIEHSSDPAGELRRASSLLKKGGLLVLTTPNIGSLPARIWGPRWMGIKQDEHLFYFTPESIGEFLSKCGLKTVRLKHVGKYIDIDFFIQRTGLYSKMVERGLGKLAGALRIGESSLYVNPFDIMMVYAKKVDASE
jgi:2-polyprenyl-3-methyl-5-hydroxy-6-metoxy-1,4-benzoquinol methylase